MSGTKSRVYRKWKGNVAVPSTMHTKPTKSYMGSQLSMGKGEKKGTALKVVTGQGSSFEGEERKGVRKSEKGRKQTTLISHLPPSPTTDTPATPSRINSPAQGLLDLNSMYPFPSYLSHFQIELEVFYFSLISLAFLKHNSWS